MKIQSATVAFFLCLIAVLQAGEIKVESLILRGGAKVTGDVLCLDGKNAYALIPGTETFNIGPKGLTVACAVKLNAPSGRTKDENGKDISAGHDMFFSKGKLAWIFGRRDTRMYSNIRNDKNEFSSPFYTGFTPEAGVWYHVAIIFEPYNDSAQGSVGYNTKIYLNGDRVGGIKKSEWLKPIQNEELIEIGKGWGGVWMLNGEISEIFVEQRALNDAEITDLADTSRKVKVKTYRKVNPSLEGLTAGSAAGQWLLRSLNAAPSSEAVKIAEELKSAWPGTQDEDLIRAYEKERHGLLLYEGEDILALLNLKSGKGSPVLGVYDRKAKRPVLEDRLFDWEIKTLRNGRKKTFASEELDYTVSAWKDDGFLCTWKADGMTVESRFDLNSSGIAADLKADNADPGMRLEEVVYPYVRFARAGHDDFLLYPFMCGALVPDPTFNSFFWGQQNKPYPSGSMTMQFAAYYGGGRGSFLGWRDPHGTAKTFSAIGKRGGLEMYWEQSVKYTALQEQGGNSYASPGKIALQVYTGTWFEACKIHREAMRSADWFIEKLPRQDTPEWYRDTPLVLRVHGFTKEQSEVDLLQLEYLYRYFEVPIFLSVDFWDDPEKGGWPAFIPRDFIPGYFRKLKEIGYRIEPYGDSLLWTVSMHGKKDPRYEAYAHNYAVKNADGTVPVEIYGGHRVYAVMCPAVPEWQDELMRLYTRYKEMGFSSLHHDQIGTTPARLCFDPAHGHDFRDPDYWLRQGYRPLYKKMREKLLPLPFSTEEMSEPFIDLFDGGHVWRWTHAGQVPAFQAVYGVACQYLQLDYDAHGKGEYASNFVKMANALVNGLKMGKFLPNEFYNADSKRLFAKKMSHLRMALNPYLNGGEMMKPVRFASPVPLRTTSWSNFSRTNENVTMPEVISNSWDLHGVKVYIFINTMDEPRTVEPLGIRGYLCLEGAVKPSAFSGRIKLGPYASAVVLDGPENEAEAIQQTLWKIASFTPGESFSRLVRFKEVRRIRAEKGKWYGPADVSGFHNLVKAASGDHFGNTAANSMISYGLVDFGSEKVFEISVKLAVPDQYAGKTFDLLAGSSQIDCRSVGTFTVPSTKSWSNFQEFRFPLKEPLTGEKYLIFQFNAGACCNFRGWKFF